MVNIYTSVYFPQEQGSCKFCNRKEKPCSLWRCDASHNSERCGQCLTQLPWRSAACCWVARVNLPVARALTPFRHRRVEMCHPYVGRQYSGNPLIVLVIGPYNFKGGRVWRFRGESVTVWRFRGQRLPAPALISPLIDYVPRWIALLCLVVCIAGRCQIVSRFVPGGCCVALQMLMRAGVLSWIKPGERFRSSLGSVVIKKLKYSHKPALSL